MAGGRPRSFDRDAALDAAMRLFWERGYDAAGVAELTEAMGITPPSMYAAFGNKDDLFRLAVDRYVAGPAKHLVEAIDQPTARGVAEHLLRGAVRLAAGQGTPRGCITVQGALAVSVKNRVAHDDLAARRRAGEELLARRLCGADPAELPPGQSPAGLARYLFAVNYGIAVQAAGGAGVDELDEVVDTVLALWGDQGRRDITGPATDPPGRESG